MSSQVPTLIIFFSNCPITHGCFLYKSRAHSGNRLISKGLFHSLYHTTGLWYYPNISCGLNIYSNAYQNFLLRWICTFFSDDKTVQISFVEVYKYFVNKVCSSQRRTMKDTPFMIALVSGGLFIRSIYIWLHLQYTRVSLADWKGSFLREVFTEYQKKLADVLAFPAMC